MTDALLTDQPPRMLPPLTDANRAFWTGGFDGRLMIHHCPACDRWVHPPTGTCPGCDGATEAVAVSGRGSVFTFTVNRHAFNPTVPTPYVIAVVTIDESDDVRIPTNIVGADPDSVEIGMPVRVRFEDHDTHAVPVFEPLG